MRGFSTGGFITFVNCTRKIIEYIYRINNSALGLRLLDMHVHVVCIARRKSKYVWMVHAEMLRCYAIVESEGYNGGSECDVE